MTAPARAPMSGFTAAHPGDRQRVDELVELGIDSPLKLDVIAAIDQRAPEAGRVDALAALCGVASRELLPALEALSKFGLVEVRRYYNIAEYAFRPSEELRDRLRSVLGSGPEETRRLRRGLLAREARISLA